MMSNSTRVVGRHGIHVAAIIAAAALVLAACRGSSSSAGSGGSPTPSGSTSSPSAVAYAACMRQHGVPNYPDPDSTGNLTKQSAQHLGVSTSEYQSAQQACQHLLPSGGSLDDQVRQCSLNGDCPPALVQQMLSGGRIFAQCMRNHGVSKWPDPKLGGPNNTPMFPVAEAGLSRAYTHSSQVRAKEDECGQQPAALALPMG
jgi:hypothetical protein